MTAQTNVNDIQVDVNHIAVDIIQRDYENKIEIAHEDEMLESWFDSQAYTDQLIDDAIFHNCLESAECDWEIDLDGAPINIDCKLESIDVTF